ncbi:tripartite tricarboxylate transporter TctB family protein [Agromyces archimandritae]|uniref:Tripartite tricarboxylate transporter TctB family protein n=1 Tax=Agromyces archimandritae TaxID=2781962 RepID=A0A975FMB9_9MICO|nr:tripartite tricarboxylate transporter TctB family protein [Agromyces archimandritae]QTX04527.1 tripartite tricarboxylate transporter TctB family protein [Agromyces archimandritae]
MTSPGLGAVPPAADTTPVPIDESAEPAGPLNNLIAAGATAALGVYGFVSSFAFGIGTPQSPGPGLWPMLISAAVVVLSLAQIIVGRRGGGGEVFVRGSWMAAAGLATLIAYVAVLPFIGFEIPTLLLTAVWMRFLGHETWLATAITAVSVVVVFYLVFVVALSTAVPHLF